MRWPLLALATLPPASAVYLGRPLPLQRQRAAVRACADPRERFTEWMAGATPSAGEARAHTLLSSNASSLVGALAHLWTEIAREVSPERRRGPSLTVVLFPKVGRLQSLEAMRAFDSHILACRDCCDAFGRTVRSMSLHPEYSDAPFRAPYPSVTLSSRVGPVAMRPNDEPLQRPLDKTTEGDATQEDTAQVAIGLESSEREELPSPSTGGAEQDDMAMARQKLASLLASPAASKAPPHTEAEILDKTIEWFQVYFARVYRVMGSRQRRLVVPYSAGAEEAYRTLWLEASLLVNDELMSGNHEETTTAALVEPNDPISSLIVLPGFMDQKHFKRFVSSVALGLATLRLDEAVQVSAFHPRDTFQIMTADDGSREWNMTLSYPIVHIVRKAVVS